MRHLLATLITVLGIAFAYGSEPVAGKKETAIGAGETADDFYKGKTIKIVVPYGTGGGFDNMGRLVGKFLGGHIPGNPAVIVENRPGAGGLVGANAVYNSESKDGTVILLFPEQSLTSFVLGHPGFRFDPLRFQYLAVTEQSNAACRVRTDRPIKDFKSLIKGPEVTLASIGTNTLDWQWPTLMNAVLGTKFYVIPGYRGAGDRRLAVLRGEVDGVCTGYVAGSEGTTGDVDLSVLLVMNDQPRSFPELERMPTMADFVPDKKALDMFKVLSLPLMMSKAFVVAPEVPADRVEVLRKAFAETLTKDPDFRSMVQRSTMKNTFTYRRGEEARAVVEEILKLPKEQLADLRRILTP